MKVTVLAGDGIGPEITDAALVVLKKTADVFGLDISYDHKLMGGCAYDRFGTPCRKKPSPAPRLLTGCCWGPWEAPNGITSKT